MAPFQKWARDLYELRQRNFLKDDPMFLTCKPAGALRQFQMPYGNQFLEDKAFGRIFLMAGGGNHDWHFIYTDGRFKRAKFAATTQILCITETREAIGKGIRSSSIPKG